MKFSKGSQINDYTIAEDSNSKVIKRTVFRKDSSLEYIGFYKDDTPIGMHHVYNSQGRFVKTVRYGDNGEVI